MAEYSKHGALLTAFDVALQPVPLVKTDPLREGRDRAAIEQAHG